MLEIKNLSKTYKNSNRKAVDNVSITIEDGDIYGFIGPNGAGKSTTIKCIVGIHNFDQGDIFLDGVSIKFNPIESKRKMAYVPDNPDLYEHLSGIGYIDFVCNIYGVGQEKDELIHKYASLFNIESKLADPIKTYSHGMKQKVALITAFVHKPKLLVLDEPFVGLDPKASAVLKQYMRKLCDEGSAIFFSTDVLEAAEILCDRIAMIDHGHIVVRGKVDDLTKDKSLEEVFLEQLQIRKATHEEETNA